MDRRTFLIAGLATGFAPRAFAQDDEVVRMRDLYNKDLSFSDYAKSMEGRRISVQGFMAPPLKADSNFFVLTKRPMAVCPFCETEAEWPNDILAVYTKRTLRTVPFNVRIVTSGELALGTYTDPELGFVSRVRLVDSTVARG
ncbi:hypothetical protein [Oricola sp.]|uniref:hypothetical protein n=1 Tax=Oricola sp. TaxID=1979950 RepID=UPI0025F92582|nr:hypothetical protein [Oricola sp.]MCI5077411.1 hypothetical protein [Oricola sp.]